MQPTPSIQRPLPPSGDTLTRIIPYKNTPALLAYYFGVFGLIPGLIPLSIAAVVMGVFGIKKQKRSPDTKGRVHAMIGLGLGIFELVVFILFIIFVVAVSDIGITDNS